MASALVMLSTNTFLKGKIVYARDSKKPVYAFLGVPFAEPPVGHLRFKHPQPVQLWKGEREAVKFGNVCPQNFEGTAPYYIRMLPSTCIYPMPTEHVSEDCLYLNVWSPSLTPSKKMPVMVWIHGGAYIRGFSNYYDGTAVCTLHDVVFVSINYRLGPLGFLPSLGEEVHSNCGILDQVEALRWIKQYIANFGGDPDNVTLFGHSSGGISISLHCLSPLTKDLFHRAICQSGTALYPPLIWRTEDIKNYFPEALKSIGCTDMTEEGMVKFLRKTSAEELIKADPAIPGVVIIDNYYILKDPLDLYKAGKFHDVDLLVGFSSDEGCKFLLERIQNKRISRTNVRHFVGSNVDGYFRGMPGGDELIEAIMNEYFGPDVTSEDMLIKTLSDVWGDGLVMPAILTAKHHSVRCQTYVYLYNHRPSYSSYPEYIKGAGHGQEIPVMIGEPFLDRFPDIWSESEKQLSKNMMAYWVNFATTGDPNDVNLVPWHEYKDEAGKDYYLTINTHPSVHCQFSPRREYLWNKLLPEIHQKCQSTK